MTKYKYRVIAQGKETALMKSQRERKEKMEQEKLKQNIINQIEKEDQEKKERFEKIIWMAYNHPIQKLESMLGQSMIPYLNQSPEVQFNLLCAYTMGFFLKLTKDIEELKQCLNKFKFFETKEEQEAKEGIKGWDI